MVVFTKFDGQIIQESEKLDEMENDAVKWEKARENAEETFQKHYLNQIMTVQNPPKAVVKLEGKTFHCDTS